MTPAAAPPTRTPPRTQPPRTATFAALAAPGFRIYLAGQSVANTGNWMQSIAVDWLVLQLTGSATAVGITVACQFLPMLLLGGYGGVIADRFDKRRVLLTTQLVNAALTTSLAVLTVSGAARVEHVWLFALAAGLVFVVDNPTRQVFVHEVVGPHLVRNAIALNSATFQTTRLIGPALAAVLIGTVGLGWAFAVNALCFLGPTVGLLALRPHRLRPAARAPRGPGQLRAALRYVRARPHVAATIALVGVIGTFGLNFPIVLTVMAASTFGAGAGLYGLFNVALALGSVAGALVAGGRTHSRLRLLVGLAAAFGLCQAATALAPSVAVFLPALVVLGAVNLAFQAMANSTVQLWVAPAVRGRVMGLYMLAFTGGHPLGAPLVGAITTHAGPRVGMAVCGLVPLLAALAVAAIMARHRRATRAAATPGPPPHRGPPRGTPPPVPPHHPCPRRRPRRAWRPTLGSDDDRCAAAP